MSAIRDQADRTIAQDLAEIIAGRAIADLDCPPAYLRTLGFSDATLTEHLPAAEELARGMLDDICRELAQGISLKGIRK